MRLRFAPSPTGSLHLGNARTALVNWLEARRQSGTLVLRLEDTDVERNVEGAEAAIMGDLAWLGIDWDEGPDRRGPHGPYRQSERGARYRAAVDALHASGAAYPCFCSPGRLGPAPDAADRAVGHGYPGTCRNLSAEQVARRLEAGAPAAIRLRVPDADIRFEDGLRGSTGVQAGEVDDFVIARADGSPTYLLAVVVDDHDMQIDHVIRGQDHLSNTPRQILIYQALGWSPPRFSHLPLVLGADRSRLSKRHGAASVADMRRCGILPEALANYLALLGWAPPGDEEVLSMQELVDAFRVEDLSAANVAFDQAKLEWLNQQHLGRAEPEVLLRRSEPFLAAAGIDIGSGDERDWWRDLVQLFAPTCRRLDELPARLAGVVTMLAPAVLNAAGRAVVEAFLEEGLAGHLAGADEFRAAAKRVAAGTGSKGRQLFQPLRLALTGEEHGPELARLVPLLDRVAGLDLRPPMAPLNDRLSAALGSL